MSGGHYDYQCFQVREFADKIELSSPLRKKFQKLLLLASEAAYKIEWEDSGDTDIEETEKAIKKCFAFAKKCKVE